MILITPVLICTRQGNLGQTVIHSSRDSGDIFHCAITVDKRDKQNNYSKLPSIKTSVTGDHSRLFLCFRCTAKITTTQTNVPPRILQPPAPNWTTSPAICRFWFQRLCPLWARGSPVSAYFGYDKTTPAKSNPTQKLISVGAIFWSRLLM